MTDHPLLNPSRGLMIEQLQPVTRRDITLAKHILEHHDEVIIAIGDAGTSHAPGRLLSAGERLELTDTVLQAEGLDPNRYILIPVENTTENANWVAEVTMLAPRFDAIYTRNSLNATMFDSFTQLYGYTIHDVAGEKPQEDLFALYAGMLRGDPKARHALERSVTDSTVETMRTMQLENRVAVTYDHAPLEARTYRGDRALFLGGLQPFTGVWEDRTGHLGVVRQGLDAGKQVVIAVGSAQDAWQRSDPLTAGQRIETIRYALRAHGVDASRFSTVPVKDIWSHPAYPVKLISLTPSFDSVIAGNDWTQQLFKTGGDHYEVIPVQRSEIPGSTERLSGTGVRNTVYERLATIPKGEALSTEVYTALRQDLKHTVDPATLDILQEVGFYQTMHFLAHARE